MAEPRVVGAPPPPDVLAALASATRLATLEEVLACAHAHRGDVVDVVVQDEYTHDVIVRGPAPAYLCFDTT
jgi:hypothetical protein